MEDKNKYNYTYKLKHDEQPAFINMNTGEISTIDTSTMIAKDTGASVFNQDVSFFKGFSHVWEWLYYQLSPIELKVAMYMAFKAAPITNSLDPLGDDCSVRELSKAVDISLGKVKSVFQKLFDLGVYAKFEVTEQDKKYMKYWLLNPYLSIKSKVVKDSVVNLFVNTTLSKAASAKMD